MSLWIKPAGKDSVYVEIEGYGYDGALRFDYDLCVHHDATGQLGRELLTRLIGREVVARVAAELGVPYDRR